MTGQHHDQEGSIITKRADWLIYSSSQMKYWHELWQEELADWLIHISFKMIMTGSTLKWIPIALSIYVRLFVIGVCTYTKPAVWSLTVLIYKVLSAGAGNVLIVDWYPPTFKLCVNALFNFSLWVLCAWILKEIFYISSLRFLIIW